jgi:hypothetical protein
MESAQVTHKLKSSFRSQMKKMLSLIKQSTFATNDEYKQHQPIKEEMPTMCNIKNEFQFEDAQPIIFLQARNSIIYVGN